MDRKTLNDWLAWMEQCHPREMDLGLERIERVGARLLTLLPTQPSRFFTAIPVITVAGTNGKGSTVALIDQVLRHSGYRVGTYTSPHLLRYNERVTIDGSAVSDDELCAALALVDQARADVALTYFEIGTLAALVILQQAALDAVVLEVGLGGRLDAVNMVDPTLAVITSIDLDHQDWLGHDRDSIAREKCGIMRRGIAAVCGDPQPPAMVAQCAQAVGARLLQRGIDFDWAPAATTSWSWWGRASRGDIQHLDNLPVPRLPMNSVATALQVLQQLDLPVDQNALRAALATASLPGRLQTVTVDGVPVTLDVAHNPAAARQLAASLPLSAGKTHAVVALLADKDADGFIDALSARIDCVYAPELSGVARARPSVQLAHTLREHDILAAGCYDSVGTALGAALSNCRSGDRVLVTGSFYTVAAALRWLSERE